MKENKTHKKGVVMVITLALIMALTLLILKNMTTTEKYLSDVSKSVFYAQLNRSFLDMNSVLKGLDKHIKDSDSFSLALKMPIIIKDKKSGIKAILKLNSGSGKFNINNLLVENKINESLYELIYSILTDYDVVDGGFFMTLLLDTIDSDDEQRAYGSEFSYLQGAKLSDGGILNMRDFNKILNYYAKSQKDENIYKIPWEKFIKFSGDEVDYNYLDEQIKANLEQNYGITNLNENSIIYKDEDLSLNKEQKKLFKSLNIGYYVPIFLCDFEFHFSNKKANISFYYDLNTKRISDIETIF